MVTGIVPRAGTYGFFIDGYGEMGFQTIAGGGSISFPEFASTYWSSGLQSPQTVSIADHNDPSIVYGTGTITPMSSNDIECGSILW